MEEIYYNKYLPVPMETVNCFEVWWPVKDYEGIYEVSNLGRVKSLNYKRTGKERILKPQKDKYGYFTVNLSKNGKVKRHSLHRLVCEAFNRLPENHHADHQNWIRTDNRSLNVRPLQASENISRISEIGKIAKSNVGKTIGLNNIIKALSKPVKQIDLKTGKVLKTFSSASEAGRELGVNRRNICQVATGMRKSCGGYGWEY